MIARADTGRRAVASLLDRLLDAHPDQVEDRRTSAAETLVELRDAVRRDVEALLNARRPWRSPPAASQTALRVSTLGYGIPDFTGGAFNDVRARDTLRSEIELAIRRFEPRLEQVSVQLADPPSPFRATLRLRIDALLLVHPQPEPVSFDAAVDVTASDVDIRACREI